MRSSPAAQPSQNGCVSGVGTGTGLSVIDSPHTIAITRTSFWNQLLIRPRWLSREECSRAQCGAPWGRMVSDQHNEEAVPSHAQAAEDRGRDRLAVEPHRPDPAGPAGRGPAGVHRARLL